MNEEEVNAYKERKIGKKENLNLTHASHPLLCLLHVGLKGFTLFLYLFFRLITSSSVYTFISVIIASAVDFWFVKNVAGRILVGLRWWHNDFEIGQNEWHFESYNVEYTSSEVDKSVFWLALISSTGVWGVLLVLKVLGLSLFWGMLVGICFAMSASNLYGYYLCRKDHQEKVRKFMVEFGKYYKDFGKITKDGVDMFMNRN